MDEVKCTFCGQGRNDVKKLIAGPELSELKIFICNNCVEVCHDVIHDVSEEEKDTMDYERMIPSAIKDHLDEYVIGQDEAKRAISVAIYNHYKRINNRTTDPDTNIEKSNLLMIGPSGVGKTHIVKTVAKLFNIPYVHADATSITEAGYVGDDAVQILDRLVQSANGDVERAATGIIFVDEVDKISKKGESATVSRDVSGEGVQQALLKLVEGTNVHLSDGESTIDTTNILFVASGAFIGLSDLIKRDRVQTSIGINASIPDEAADQALVKDVTPQDLIKYGLIPEFIGRFPIVVTLDDLDEKLLTRILKEPKNNLLSQFTSLFKIDGVDLEFNDRFITNVAQQSISRKTGARGLRSIMEHTLRDVQFSVPDMVKDGLNKISVEDLSEVNFHYNDTPLKKQVNSGEDKK